MKISNTTKAKSFYHEAADMFCVQHSFAKEEQELGIARLPSLFVVKNFDEKVKSAVEVNELNINRFQHKSKVKNLFYEEIGLTDEDVYTFLVKNGADIFADTLFVVDNEQQALDMHLYGAHIMSSAQATVLVTKGEGKTILGWQDSKLHLHDSQLNLVHGNDSLTYAGGLFLNRDAVQQLQKTRILPTRSVLDNNVVYIERVDVLQILDSLENLHFVLV